MTDIMNGGIIANILKYIQDKGGILKKEDEEFMNKMLDLPKNEWISLDANGEPITQKQANEEFMSELTKYRHIK
ncbi:hypothetical protein Phi4:1_gp113 [Cellulophaga phage phi4:1]|jgi:predicted rRNA methylase YqxC with S4 and FtsJ domains|uniref:Uncharacterized protein n=5 Tax=Lightbulbvirus TaxID=1918522 RepID=A0A0S2MWM2_9CAUD|nr:hypothetical protein Phi4:1_gp113 [Cellulophaga phage phi4:1]YP_008241612.1 hypothetical protein Phi17:2_gp117 [Cellulophaga phage phi17:2]ALO80122.1 hypothetical protein Phi4113_113 [Cellulophaga phage phi4:1_13]ALO80319.1 hypothetical protein Phi4118_113 [Cellulophaga phage phi4:1_18]ALO80520.1 hypothetical protein Phi17218_117 [Cellulophaga phage phi17:2_18]AGO47650.1 hypothetical protein Phi17:2_gp117 [Cellulophaga phage phi17:2]AGO49526.1 hypothetical protein Phi4:1_gp113 [Cellulophag